MHQEFRDQQLMRRSLSLARRASRHTSPNPVVGAVLARNGKILGEGWHRRAGSPHAEIEALDDARSRGNSPSGATLYVTLEPCCTHGRTPPCTEAIIRAGIRRVVIGALDPNPAHAGRGPKLLQDAGIEVAVGILAPQAHALNRAFEHWIVHHTPLVTLKAALTLDGKIATRVGESQWITGPSARKLAGRMRAEHDAVLVGINTVLADDPGLLPPPCRNRLPSPPRRPRIVLDSRARTPPNAQVLRKSPLAETLIVVGERAPKRRVAELERLASVWIAPTTKRGIDLQWLVAELGKRPVTSLLVEGGGEVHASFLAGGVAHRMAFFYAPKILGGFGSRRGIGGEGFAGLQSAPRLRNIRNRIIGEDLLIEADLAR
jgi:diaminohydroxyphosphoribosylaminopyrimidine deaminase/5-amino-6-(5-phosphoribosylamino)uracil reductase